MKCEPKKEQTVKLISRNEAACMGLCLLTLFTWEKPAQAYSGGSLAEELPYLLSPALFALLPAAATYYGGNAMDPENKGRFLPTFAGAVIGSYGGSITYIFGQGRYDHPSLGGLILQAGALSFAGAIAGYVISKN